MTAPKPTEYVGRLTFLPAAKQEYLFFIPKEITPALKILESSMWSKRDTPDHGLVYRCAPGLEPMEWLKENLGPLLMTQEVYLWYRRQVEISPIEFSEDNPLLDFQREAISFLSARDRAMLSLSPGLGKTLCSIYSASLTDARTILVVAPKSLLYMWKAELEKWADKLPRKPVAMIWQKKPVIEFPPVGKEDTFWIITNPETVVSNVSSFEREKFDLMILDESILYKNRRAKRTSKISDLAKKIKKIWLLTGAPANRMLDDLWAQFHLLKPKTYASYWRFAKEYCIVDETPWGAKVAANKLRSEEKIKHRFRDIYFARSQDEVMDIPDWLFEEIDLPMTKKQEKIYNELRDDLFTKIDTDEGLKKITADNGLTLAIRLVQAASNPMLLGYEDATQAGKWNALSEIMQMYPGPYIIWTSFIASAKFITEMMKAKGYNAEFMIGETKPEDRQKLVDQLQSGYLDVLVTGQAVGSFGLTLTKARTAIYVERNFDGNYFQSLHRIRRIGTEQRPHVIHLRSVHENGSKTIDHAVHGLLDYRVNMIKDLTVGMLRDI